MTDSPTPSSRSFATGRLSALADSMEGPHVTLGEIVDRLGHAGFGLVLLVMTLIILIPIPGPIGMIFGTLIIFMAIQLLTGARRLWVPEVLRRRHLPAAGLRAFIEKTLPWLESAEARLKPRRWIRLSGGSARMALAIPLAGLGAAITLPIPLGNFMPALALIAMSLGLIARDGLAILVGLALTVLALGWTAALVFAGAEIYQTVAGWIA